MKVSFKANTKFNILYFSDNHGKTNNLASFKTAVDSFDKENEGQNNLKLAGGDLNVDTAIKPNIFTLKFMDLISLDASSLGNHDLEGGNYMAMALEKAKPKFKFLATNLNFKRDNKLENKIAKSTIIEKNREKVGVIGVSPIDYGDLTFIAPFNDFVRVKKLDETIKEVKSEINKLESQGINKIFLLAHTGKTSKDGTELYERLADIGGVDVIIGGHDHNEFDAWYISERKEPVKVVSTGKNNRDNLTGEDLDSFGILNATFDKNGVLIPEECRNKIELTQNYPKSDSILKMENDFLKTNDVICYSNIDMSNKNKMTEEKPIGSLAADAMLWVVNKETKGEKAQIAFVNSGTVRGVLPLGDITVGDVKQVLPFTSSTLIKTKLTKKQIFDTLNWCAQSTRLPKVTPGLMQVGGMRYSIDADKNVKDVYILNEDGSLGEKIDNQSDDKEYDVIYDIFLMTGVAGLTALKKSPYDKSVEYFSYSRQDAVIEYLTQNFTDKPLEIKNRRIQTDSERLARLL